MVLAPEKILPSGPLASIGAAHYARGGARKISGAMNPSPMKVGAAHFPLAMRMIIAITEVFIAVGD